ncbi:MAG: type II secretion system protein [Bdellovibrionales bacterium]|nr:type II secretion system protein [Bdellovibrionales bacterium]
MAQLVRKYHTKFEAGFGLIELLVAFVIVAIVIAGASRLFINIMFANGSVRDNAIIIAEVQEIVDGYRGMPYIQILDLFGSGYVAIENGQTVTTNVPSENSGVAYTVKLTAVKSMAESVPEAIQIDVAVNQSRWKFSTLEYSFATLISQVS